MLQSSPFGRHSYTAEESTLLFSSYAAQDKKINERKKKTHPSIRVLS